MRTNKTTLATFAALAAFALSVSACGNDADTATNPETPTIVEGSETVADNEETKEKDGSSHWSYEGEEGPENWGALDEAFAVCESGTEQSPIDVASDATPADIEDPVISWTTGDVEMINNGHTIQANVSPGSTTMLNGNEYDLVQFHWHKPSENTLDGDPFAMELHFVHADSEGNLAVLAVLLEEGDALDTYDTLWAVQPAEGELATAADIDFTTLLPSDLSTVVFPGSLTTPPCSEGVAWNVLTTPAQMSAAQLDAFLYSDNARPVQPTNGRELQADNS